ncbi:MAG: hypothetical protein LJE70_00500 [Chromatiaceae bacterium]|jgi:hypothetical protein|nr:hypothetical protein [Chromatiaceae bacterium]
MNLRFNPLYKTLLMLTIVLGPIVWLVFTEDGQRRTDLVMLFLFGKAELDLAMEQLNSEMTEAQFRELFPDLELACDEGANPFGDRLCTAEVGAFNAIPSRAFTLFLQGEGLRAAQLNYRRAYHETLELQLRRRLGSPVPQSLQDPGPAIAQGPLAWAVSDGMLLLPSEEPKSDADAALIWLSQPAVQQRLRASENGN